MHPDRGDGCEWGREPRTLFLAIASARYMPNCCRVQAQGGTSERSVL